jgi:hypothetical protein
MKTRWLWCLAGVCVLSVTLQAQDRQSLIEWLVEEPAWAIPAEAVEFDEDGIDALAPAQAGAIRKYGLRGASLFTVTGQAGSVDVTIYEMIDSTAAYGLFTLERDWVRSGFELGSTGSESYLLEGELVFWQSKYVAKLRGSVDARTTLGDALSANIVGRSAKPPVSRHLPPEGLVAGSEKYLLDPAAFESSVGLDPRFFGFDDSVEVALATYDRDGTSARLVMLLYPTQQLAKKHSEAWIAATENPPANKRAGPLLAIVDRTDDDSLADGILAASGYESQITWNEGIVNALTLPHMILTIFRFIGLALLFTAMVGVGFGGLRIYMKTRYPDRYLGGASDVELIQLKINQHVTPKQLNE